MDGAPQNESAEDVPKYVVGNKLHQKMPSVSIVIPVLNRAAYLPELFQTLEAVTYEQVEVVLVDNGSVDDSLALCRDFSQRTAKSVRVVEEPAPGACAARNRGLAECQSEWVYFFDSDDLMSASFLSEVMPSAADCDMLVVPTMQQVGERTARRDFVVSDAVASQILSSSLNTQGMLWRTQFLKSIGGWNESLLIWNDWELAIRALLHSPRICWLPEKSYHLIRVHADSITGPSLASRYDRCMHTMEVVEKELSNPQDLRALDFRRAIFCGKAHAAMSVPHRPGNGLLHRMLCRLLWAYSACGGRGAWRIALFALQK